MASKNNADIINLQVKQGFKGKYAKLRVRKNPFKGHKLDVRAMMLGDKDVGKSTLITVLQQGELDEGEGEIITEMLSHHIIEFDQRGQIVNYDIFGPRK